MTFKPISCCHEVTFRKVAELADLAAAGPPAELALSSRAMSPRVAGDLVVLGAPISDMPELKETHQARKLTAPITAFAFEGHFIGGEGLIVREDSLFFSHRIYPGYIRNIVNNGLLRPPSTRAGALHSDDPIIMEVDGLCAAPFHFNDSVYGHFLIETLPKLLLLWHLKHRGLSFKVAASNHLPKFAQHIMSIMFRDDEIIRYDPVSIVLRPKRILTVSSVESDYYFHPAANNIFDAIKLLAVRQLDREPSTFAERIFITRRQLPNVSFRCFKNSDEIEDLFRDRGFCVVAPEQLTFANQVRLFDSCRVLAGEYGSGLHGALFMQPGTSVISINRINAIQSRIAALRSQQLTHVVPADGAFRKYGDDMPAEFVVNPNDVQAILDHPAFG